MAACDNIKSTLLTILLRCYASGVVSAVVADSAGLKHAFSLLPEPAGSRSPERLRQGVDAVYKDSSQPRFACGVLIKFDCRHGLGCTADWWRSECAGESGRSRRPGQWRLLLSRDSAYSESGGPPKGSCGEGNAAGNSVDAGCLKEASFRSICREGNRPQSLEIASLLKLVATNVLFSTDYNRGHITCRNRLCCG